MKLELTTDELRHILTALRNKQYTLEEEIHNASMYGDIKLQTRYTREIWQVNALRNRLRSIGCTPLDY